MVHLKLWLADILIFERVDALWTVHLFLLAIQVLTLSFSHPERRLTDENLFIFIFIQTFSLNSDIRRRVAYSNLNLAVFNHGEPQWCILLLSFVIFAQASIIRIRIH